MVKLPICTLASVLVLGAPGLSQEISPDRATELYHGAVRAIRTFDVRVETTIRFLLHTEVTEEARVDPKKGIPGLPVLKTRKLLPGEKPTVWHQFSRQVYQQGKGRIEILDSPGGGPSKIAAYDGEVRKTRDVQAGKAIISKPFGSTTFDGGDYRETYMSTLRGINFHDLPRSLRERQGYVVATGPTADSPLITLEAKPVPKEKWEGVNYATWSFRVGLDPRRGMMPAFIEVLQPVGGKLHLYRRTTVNDWKDIGNGLQVPVKATTHIFYVDPKNKEVHGEVANEVVLAVDVARSSWNKEVAEEATQLPLPAGTEVTDMERGVRYVTGKPDAGKNLESLAAHARDVVPIRVNPPPEPGGWPSWVRYGSTALAVALVFGVGAWFLRKRRLGYSR